MIKPLSIIFWLISLAGTSLAEASGPLPEFIGTCNGCTQNAQFAKVAGDLVAQEPGADLDTESHEVYVLNLSEAEVRAFTVSVDREKTAISSGEGYRIKLVKSVMPAEGDPEMKAAMEDALVAVSAFPDLLASAVDFQAWDRPVDSAIDLFGPGGSLALRRFAVDLGDELTDAWSSQISKLGDTAQDLANLFVGWSNLYLPSERMLGFSVPKMFPVEFSDGTSMQVVVKQTLTLSPSGPGMGWMAEVQDSTVSMPDGTPFPINADYFPGFSWDDARADQPLAKALRDLALHHGVEVGEGKQCRFDCDGGCALDCRS